MKTTYILPLLLVILLSTFACRSTAENPVGANKVTEESPETNVVTIHADQGKDKISKNIYGHFAEHLGRCIYDGFWVGADSDIPNTRGIRNDVVQALKKLNIPVLRWPGGCFADDYHWLDGIGPRDKRPKTINIHWGQVIEDNQFGTHEFLDLCEMLGCDAYIAGNVGSGTPEELRDWIEYMTFDGDSDLANLRRKNGRDKPWKVKFIGVGNENWGCGGDMTADYYADLYKRFAVYVRNFSGNEIVKVAGGPGGSWHRDWMDTLMRKANRQMDAVSLHYYVMTGSWGNKGSATNFNAGDWFKLMKNSLDVEEVIKRNIADMDRYDRQKRIGLFVDEWGCWWNVEPGTNSSFLYQQNTMRDAVSAGIFLNIFNNYCQRVKMANIAQTNNVLQAMVLTKGEKMLTTPTYHTFEMYKVHQGATLLPSNVQCDTYRFEGSDIPLLSVSASKDDSGKIHISVCNLSTNKTVKTEFDIEGAEISKCRARVLTAEKMTAHNTFEEPDAVKPAALDELKISDNKIIVQIPSKSVTVLEVE